jgi:hypothetical protein
MVQSSSPGADPRSHYHGGAIQCSDPSRPSTWASRNSAPRGGLSGTGFHCQKIFRFQAL